MCSPRRPGRYTGMASKCMPEPVHCVSQGLMPGSREVEAFVAQSVSRRRKRSLHLFLQDMPMYDLSVETFCSHPPRSNNPHAMDLLFNTGVIMVRRDASRADSTCAFKSQGWEEGKVGREGGREAGRGIEMAIPWTLRCSESVT